SVYNLQFAVRLETKLNLRALEESLAEIVRRHESLRTTFGTVDGQPVQIIAEGSEVRLSVIDLSERSSAEQESEVRRLAEAESERPFDLANGALLRLKLLKLAESESVLLITMHHIVTDGWSMGVFLSELTALYQSFSRNEPSPLTELSVQYADYA